MRNLLFYLDYRSRSGAQRVMVELANYFAKHGDKVTLACQFQSPEEGYALADEVTEIILPAPSKNKLKRQSDRIKHLCDLCGEVKPDLIISFLIVSNLIAIKAGRKMGIPVLISVRNDPARDGNKLNQWLIKRNYPKASGCVFQTEEAKEFFGFSYPTRVIENPISEEVIKDLEKFEGCEDTPKADSSLHNFASVGRLEPQKRHDIAIKALANVIKDGYKAKLTIYGKGPLEQELKDLAKSLGIEQNAIFAGVTSEVIGKLKESDAFLMTSDYEGMPNALMEAMAAGLPCIVTDCPCGGPRALIKDKENGYLVNVNDEESVASAMKCLIDSPEEAKNAGKKARKIIDRCNIDQIAPKWGEMFDLCRKTQP